MTPHHNNSVACTEASQSPLQKCDERSWVARISFAQPLDHHPVRYTRRIRFANLVADRAIVFANSVYFYASVGCSVGPFSSHFFDIFDAVIA